MMLGALVQTGRRRRRRRTAAALQRGTLRPREGAAAPAAPAASAAVALRASLDSSGCGAQRDGDQVRSSSLLRSAGWPVRAGGVREGRKGPGEVAFSEVPPVDLATAEESRVCCPFCQVESKESMEDDEKLGVASWSGVAKCTRREHDVRGRRSCRPATPRHPRLCPDTAAAPQMSPLPAHHRASPTRHHHVRAHHYHPAPSLSLVIDPASTGAPPTKSQRARARAQKHLSLTHTLFSRDQLPPTPHRLPAPHQPQQCPTTAARKCPGRARPSPT
jgi:hypothetical protein